jgi:DNA primase
VRASGQAVVVEGYMDAIAAHEHGITDVVACMGTAITPDQLEALARLVARPAGGPPPSTGSRQRAGGSVVLCLDSDAAGEEATLRELASSWQAFSAQTVRGNIQVKVARPEGGKDPDEMIRTDRDAWQRAIAGAKPFIEWMTEAYAARLDTATPQGKAALFEAVKGPILAVSNSYEQDGYLTLLARKMGVREERVRAMLVRPAASPARRDRPRQTERVERLAASQVAAALASSDDDAIEDHLLALVLQREELREYALAVPEEHFRNSTNREIFILWRGGPPAAGPALRSFDKLRTAQDQDGAFTAPLPDNPLSGKIERLQRRALPPTDHLQRVEAINQCVRRLRERHLRFLKTLEEKAFSESAPPHDRERQEALYQRALDSNSRLRQVFSGPGNAGTGPRHAGTGRP